MKRGIDVSYANGYIDWEKVKRDNIDFAILRSTFGSDFPSQVDNQYFPNTQGCVKNSIPFGVYHFAYFINEQTARDEADFVIKTANEYRDNVKFIVLDIEEDTERYARNMGYNPDWTACSIAFLERVKESGYIPVLYANYNWLKNKLNYNKLKSYKLWYAAPDASEPTYNCAIWQYSWKGRVDGISGDVDMNYLYDESLLAETSISKTANNTIDDKTRFLIVARSYIGTNGDYICNTKLKLGVIVDWCAYSACCIFDDCGFIGTYIHGITGGAGSIPRGSDGKYGEWFKKGTKTPQAGDLFFLRYADYPNEDKYFCDHVGVVESVDGNTITTLEGNVDGVYGNWQKTSTFKRKTRYLSDSTVYAFYRPHWKTVKTTTTSVHVKDTKIYQIESSVRVNFKATVTALDGVNIRQGAGTTYKILGTIPYNTMVPITNKTSGGKHHWGLTTHDGIKGWIALDYTEQVEELKNGDKVRVKNGATVYGTNTALSSFVYNTTYKVMEVSGDRIVIGVGGQVTTAIDKKYLTKV